MNSYESYTLLVAIFSLLVAGFALGWNVFRDCVNRPKLKLNMFIANWYDSQRGELPQVISISITNTGKQPIVIKAHGFPMKDKTTSVFPDIMHFFNLKRLEPYDRIDIRVPNPVLKTLIEKAPDITAFVVCDTVGREWKLGKKEFKEFKKSLADKNSA